MEAAGLIPCGESRLWWSDEELLGILARAGREVGEDLSETEYEQWRRKQGEPLPSVETFRARFRSWNAAKEALRLKTTPPGPDANIKWNSNSCLAAIVRFLRDQLADSTYEEWAKKNGGPSLRTLREHAGGWQKALKVALEFYVEKCLDLDY